METLAIDKWNTDSVEEFLDLYLEDVPAERTSSSEEEEEAREDNLV